VVLMGDFNTPSDSVHFDSLRQGFQNAFETGGNGNAATWPVPLPVLAIDHIWTNRLVRVHSARHAGSVQSDHKAVFAELSFSE
jgi:endonuclease/exonuclease/phosphatase family metal-dependent hydrolase